MTASLRVSRGLRTSAALAALWSISACHWIRTGDPAPLRPVAASQIKTVGDCERAGGCRDARRASA